MKNNELTKIVAEIQEYSMPITGLSELLALKLVDMDGESGAPSLKEVINIADSLRLLCLKSELLAEALQANLEADM